MHRELVMKLVEAPEPVDVIFRSAKKNKCLK